MPHGNKIADLFPKAFTSTPLLSAELIRQLQRGDQIPDSDFDRIFPPYYQLQSAIHWSPITVARQVADWILPLGLTSFIDIGCGVGKLCLLLRLLTDYKIFGIEQRSKLVAIANQIITINDLKDITVTKTNMLDLEWSRYDIYYLYNPFQEQLTDEGRLIVEHDIDFDPKNYVHYTSEVLRELSRAEKGKVLITFHGYGGRVPPSWTMVKSKHLENGNLTLWIKDGS